MFEFNYNSFRESWKKTQEESHAILLKDIEKVKAFVEKALTLCLECNAHSTRVSYPGVDV